MALAKDITGFRSGRLVAIKPTKERKNSCVVWEAKCNCGKTCFVRGRSMISGFTRSCGCLLDEARSMVGKSNTKHGLTKTTEYHSWMAMRRRCDGKSGKYENKNYHERGIRVCKRWLGQDGFINFIHDVGNKPHPSYTLDRIDNDGNYDPENVRWASPKEQGKNRRKFGTLQNFTTKELLDELNRRGIIPK